MGTLSRRRRYNAVVEKPDYLTLTPNSSGTISFYRSYCPYIEYSTDGGSTWVRGTDYTTNINVTANVPVLFRAKASKLATSTTSHAYFYSDVDYRASGNPLSLYYGDEINVKYDQLPTGVTYTFAGLFKRENSTVKQRLVDASGLKLPAKVLTEGCYDSMFYNNKLSSPPSLPATTLSASCYNSMFYSCSIVKAPELPATTLAPYCYSGMFNGCTVLSSAPLLPAKTLVSNCYYRIFNGCSQLRSVTALFLTQPSTDTTKQWLQGVYNSGVVYQSKDATWTKGSGSVNTVPSGWTLEKLTNM